MINQIFSRERAHKRARERERTRKGLQYYCWFINPPTYIPADEHGSGELLLSSVVYSYVERARVYVFGYVHVHVHVHVHVRKRQFYPLDSTKSHFYDELPLKDASCLPFTSCYTWAESTKVSRDNHMDAPLVFGAAS